MSSQPGEIVGGATHGRDHDNHFAVGASVRDNSCNMTNTSDIPYGSATEFEDFDLSQFRSPNRHGPLPE